MIEITYDNYFDGISPRGVVVKKPLPENLSKEIVLVPGRFGQALRSEPSTGYVEYEAKGVIAPASGTVEMWVCLQDQMPQNEARVFFEALGEGTLYLYKYQGSTNLWMATCDTNPAGERNRANESKSIMDWMPGEWHHIAGTWSADGVMCYVDGKSVAGCPTKGWLPRTLDTFKIGDSWQPADPKGLKRIGTFLIDDVRIYDKALSPAHIAAHKDGNYDLVVPLTKELTCFKYNFDPEAGEVRIHISTRGANVDETQLSARLDIVPRGDPISSNAETFSFVRGRMVQSIISPKPGEYDVVAEVLLNGNIAFELRSALRIPTKEWQGNRLGMKDEVLPPWTPLRVRKKFGRYLIQCWGREYVFNRSALPSQITSGGESLLSSPISLQVSSGANSVELKSGSMQIISSSDTQAQLAGVMMGKLGRHVIRFNATIKIEYDGLLLVNLSCEFAKWMFLDSMSIDSMSIDIPIRPGSAMYMHRCLPDWPYGSQGYSGRVPEGDGVVYNTIFVPYVWLGDNDRGLFWFCESDERWPNSESENAIEIVRTATDVRLRLNLLEKPGKAQSLLSPVGQPLQPVKRQTLPPDWRFTFGLQATPVKPLPKDWRRWRLACGGKIRDANIQVIWPVSLEAKESDNPGDKKSDNAFFLKHFGYPEAMDSKEVSKLIGGLHATGIKTIPYLCLTALSDACPEWPFFKSYEMGIDFGFSEDVQAYPPRDKSTCLGCHDSVKVVAPHKEYCDFIVWKNKQFICSYGIDGFYHDLTKPWGSANLGSGCGYTRNNKLRPTYPILAYRELYRRMYSVIKSLQKETFTMAHMSGTVIIPILAYDDSYLNGEQFVKEINEKESYIDVMGDSNDKDRIKSALEHFRIEFMGRQWGLIPFFLPEFDIDHWDEKGINHMMALLMIHDVSPWATKCSEPDGPKLDKFNAAWDALTKIWNALKDFDYFESDFIPYFDPIPPATFELSPNQFDLVGSNKNSGVYISAYQQTDKRTLLIVANLDKEDRKGNLRINLERLGLATPELKLTVMSWWPKRELLEMDANGVLQLSVEESVAYLMIVIEVEKG